jgi:4-aminobutyrate aminotransferase-like enzyme
MRQNNIMISRTGLFNHVLKIRPPLVASIENANLFLSTFEKIVSENQGKYIQTSKI